MYTQQFMELFDGLPDAYGTGRGGWVHRPLTGEDVAEHLQGGGTGVGVAPLRRDGTVRFAAIDLDKPDFDAARLMERLLPGRTWLERSRSGNAHVWAFFAAPCEAWVARGLMRAATEAAGERGTEVFPKRDQLMPGMLGNYINLPYHGSERPMIDTEGRPFAVDWFLPLALEGRIDPEEWRRKAISMGLTSPEDRVRTAEYGQRATAHVCLAHIFQHAEDTPIVSGHRNVVYFNVAKMLLNWAALSDEDAWEHLVDLESRSPDRIPPQELRRIFENARRGQYTSTGCDDPLMAPFVSPDCAVAHGRP